MLAQAKPMWELLPAGALRDQVLGDIAERARLPATDLADRWGQASRRAADLSRASTPFKPSRTALARHQLRATTRLPQDQVARVLLQRCEWWDELTASNHDTLVNLGDWHADMFRWIDRWLSESGPTPWQSLREHLAAEPWGEQALALVDGAEVPVDPTLEDLHTAMAQTVRSAPLKQALALLSRR